VKYVKHNEDLQEFLSEINFFYKTYNSDRFKFKLVHIPPVSLTLYEEYNKNIKKLLYSKFSRNEKQLQQKQLENDIKYINSEISKLNLEYKLFSVRWDRDLMIFKSKKRGRNNKYKKSVMSFTYKNFYDGVHANRFLKDKWFSCMCNATEKDLKTSYDCDASDCNDNPQISSSSDDEDDVKENSWDFKRTKIFKNN
jgi:hypothetical protein